MEAESPNADNTTRLGVARSAVLWLLFVMICFGLGYPTLNRYDARELGPDWNGYYQTVLHQDTAENFPFNERVLVPGVARPFTALARGYIGTWDPVWFGLLMANSLFAATAAFLLLRIGLRVLGDLPLALLGSTLYLLNYVVANLWLSGMVDASEACLLLALAWALLMDRWWLLPLLGLAGGLAKQSFLPFGTAFAFTWWLVTELPARRFRRLLWVAGLSLSALATLMWAEHAAVGKSVPPWTLAAMWDEGDNYLPNLMHIFTDQQFWYAFGWLLPLGAWRLKRLPWPWVASSMATGVVALALGCYANLRGTVNRPLFTAVGPVLTLSATLLLAEKRNRGKAPAA